MTRFLGGGPNFGTSVGTVDISRKCIALMYTAQSIQDQETSVVQSQFTHDDAWTLGMHCRRLALQEFAGRSIAINVCASTGQTLFQCVLGTATSRDNDEWVRRKRNTVIRFGHSSFLVGVKLAAKGLTIEQGLLVSQMDYAVHGGAVPIFVSNVGGLVGVLTVSGLAQEEDHELAIKTLATVKYI